MDEELLTAARLSDVKKIRELVAKGADIEARNNVRAWSVRSQVPPTVRLGNN
jgi:hypothetical protein